MHNVYRLPDTHLQTVDQPATELDVIIATRQLVERIRARPADRAEADQEAVLGWLARAGLLGVSVCAEHGGPDIANAVIAEMIALLASSNVQVAERLAGHFQVIDAIRAAEAKRPVADFLALALSGEFFLLSLPGGRQVDAAPPSKDGRDAWSSLLPVRGGFRLDGVVAPHSMSSWLAFPCLDPTGRPVLALLAPPDAAAEPVVQRTDAIVAPVDVAIPASHIFAITQERDAPSAFDVLGDLLDAAIDLGLARAIFEALGRDLSTPYAGDSTADPLRTLAIRAYGRFAAQLDGVSALIERAGQHLDMVQVDQSAELLLQATLSAAAASVLAADVLEDLDAALDQRMSELEDQVALVHVKELVKARTSRVRAPRQQFLGETHVRGAVPQRWPFAY